MDALVLVVALAIASVFIFVACCVATVIVKCMKRSKYFRTEPEDGNVTLFGREIKHARDLSFLYTSGCAGLEVIGKGGCGQVFKAHLKSSGGWKLTVAVKEIILPSSMLIEELCQGMELSQERSSHVDDYRMRQVRAEIRTMGCIGHRNLLRLLAHVSSGDHHFLVSEFMPKGSLYDVLKKGQLDWPARYKIALGIASGLEYLHFIHKPCIIHRDLKPENILLDDDLNPRIADFGLAKVVHGNFVRTRLAGTLGYIAPEYYNGMPCTHKCDVFSLGVILAVLVTGRFPSDCRLLEETGMVKWVRRVMSSGEAKETVIDEKMAGNGYEEQMLLVLKIACFCTYDNPRERPHSRDVRCMISQIKH
ncbi:Non-specific serine/threonine protein kinase protein [Dioscorea alata]|uniref:Non-specific serine/threonine protein kinase protein n=1 Tax=Dioscorea alata TaxID=55571 RepID=A0ACB7U3N3_DIOAL|nr:Non-specific serine/threonine protein kinase protein [Dioscorea alata]